MNYITEVLNAAADRMEAATAWQRRADYGGGNGAGPQVYCDLFEAARQRAGWPAIEHLHRHLVRNGETAARELQGWRERDPDRVVKLLRDAAGVVPDADVELAAVRKRLNELVEQLVEAAGWTRVNHEAPETLVGEVARRIRLLEFQLEELRAELVEARQAAVTPS